MWFFPASFLPFFLSTQAAVPLGRSLFDHSKESCLPLHPFPLPEPADLEVVF